MNRRSFLGSMVAGMVLFPSLAGASTVFVDYRPGVIEDALAAGKTVFVDYSAWWCTTCRSQARTLDRLLSENPAYGQKMMFVRVDWDDFGDQPVARDRNIPRRSTLLVLRGKAELGRIVAGTSQDEIKALLDKGL
ncbi:MAG: thioredoxin family protein [Rhizobiaceae bacterium]|nr:thioredoxin family protein [Rhizobiaceae bacterium]